MSFCLNLSSHKNGNKIWKHVVDFTNLRKILVGSWLKHAPIRVDDTNR
jgi:hypothetical protein